jgi:hypothetical protein
MFTFEFLFRGSNSLVRRILAAVLTVFTTGCMWGMLLPVLGAPISRQSSAPFVVAGLLVLLLGQLRRKGRTQLADDLATLVDIVLVILLVPGICIQTYHLLHQSV